MTETKVAKSGDLRVLLLPVGSRSLVLPSVAVAKIIAYQSPEKEPSAPKWWLGRIDWRNYSIPVVSFEGIIGINEYEDSAQRTYIAILNTLNGDRALPYIGLLLHATARLLRINADSLSASTIDDLDSPLILEAVTINNRQAWIPNLDQLEWMVSSAV